MIEIEKLSELEGASKYGSCVQCGSESRTDETLVRIRINDASITLCGYHLAELKDKLGGK